MNLQVLQNKLNKLLTNSEYNTPTAELLDQTDSLSIHQMIAYQTAVTTYKVVQSGKPVYIASKMKVRETTSNTRQGAGYIQPPPYRLNISREGFIYRGTKLFNMLDGSLRTEPKLEKFKSGVREWVKNNISIKTKLNFPGISVDNTRNQPHHQNLHLE